MLQCVKYSSFSHPQKANELLSKDFNVRVIFTLRGSSCRPVIKSYLWLIAITFWGLALFQSNPLFAAPPSFHSLDNNSRTSMISRLGIPSPPPSLESILGPSFDTVFCATPIPLFGPLSRHLILPRTFLSRPQRSTLALKDARSLPATRCDVGLSCG